MTRKAAKEATEESAMALDPEETKSDIIHSGSKVYMLWIDSLDDQLQTQVRHLASVAIIFTHIDKRFKAARSAHAEQIRGKFNSLFLDNPKDYSTFLDEFDRLSNEMECLGMGLTPEDLATKLMAKVGESMLTLNLRQEFRKLPGNASAEMDVAFAMNGVREYFHG